MIGTGSESSVCCSTVGGNNDFKLFVKLRRKRKTLYRRYCFINEYYMFWRSNTVSIHWIDTLKQVLKKRNVTSEDVTNSICSMDSVLFVFSHLLIYLQSYIIRTEYEIRCDFIHQTTLQRYNVVS